MIATWKDLVNLTAADLETKLVVSLPEAMPLREAAKQSLRAGVHGAPVVDAAGRCVGVLSVTDLARWAVRETGDAVVPARREPHTVSVEWQMVQIEELPTEDVRRYMTAEPVTADPDTSIAALAQRMINAVVQRIVVTDADRRPIGIVSATDLVAALATTNEDSAEAESDERTTQHRGPGESRRPRRSFCSSSLDRGFGVA